MRRTVFCAVALILAVAAIVRFGVTTSQDDLAVAQETSAAGAGTTSAESTAAEPYPVLNVSEVIQRLTSEGSKLHQAGRTRTDQELRKHLSRRAATVALPKPSTEEVTDRELYRRACESLFIVCSLYQSKDSEEWETSLATAFVVAPDGVLTTSCHVFENEDQADAVVVMDIHERVYPVRELLAVNREADTCLFRIEASNLRPLPLAADAPPGTRIRVLGHPGDSFYFLSEGLISNYEKDHDRIVWMNVTADFGQGSSGGPVLDECGNVVGQVSRTFTLYAGGSESRGPRRKTAGVVPDDKKKVEAEKNPDAEIDVPDPQMVFKSCVPVKTLRALVRQP